MAAIRNYISLQDRMTPVFRSIMRSMDSTLKVMQKLDKQANNGVQSKAYARAERDLKRANNELIRMQNNLNQADRVTGKLATSTHKVANNMSKMYRGGLNLSNLSHGLYLLKNIANVANSIMETPDTLNAVQYRLGTYNTSAATGNQLFDASYVAAQNSRSDLAGTAGLASRILTSGATKGNGAAAIDLAELLNKASFIGGSSPQESQRALLQLSQALSSGVLQGDELRAIREQAPGLTDVLSRGLSSLGERGILPEKFIGTTMGDLKQLGADGELTSERVIAAFQEMREYVNTSFADSPKQFGQAMTGISNVWKRWLKLMSEGDNALAKINNKVWDMLEWFESESGTRFFEILTAGINAFVDIIFWCIDGIGNLIDTFNNLEGSSNILKAALISLAVVAVGAAIYMAASWIVAWVSAAWPVLLVLAILGLIIFVLLEIGVTANEIVGAICGAFMFAAYLIYDLIIWLVVVVYGAVALVWDILVVLVMIIIDAVIGVGTLIALIIEAAVQLILWAIATIVGAIVTVYNVIYSIVKGAWGLVKGAIVGVYALFVSLGTGVLGILYSIASAIDWVFGSNLADTVGGWMDGLSNSVVELEAKLDPTGEFEDIGNQWTSSYDQMGELYKDMTITDAMADTYNFGNDLIGDVSNVADSLLLDPTLLSQWGLDSTANPMDGWDDGYSFGDGLVNNLSSFDLSSLDPANIESLLGDISGDGLSVNGGDLDSVGSIKSDVDISDEDIQLLRDIAARDFLLNLQTITPQANIKFGDVRETADINKIMEVIQDMVDEELATSLVVN